MCYLSRRSRGNSSLQSNVCLHSTYLDPLVGLYGIYYCCSTTSNAYILCCMQLHSPINVIKVCLTTELGKAIQEQGYKYGMHEVFIILIFYVCASTKTSQTLFSTMLEIRLHMEIEGGKGVNDDRPDNCRKMLPLKSFTFFNLSYFHRGVILIFVNLNIRCFT